MDKRLPVGVKESLEMEFLSWKEGLVLENRVFEVTGESELLVMTSSRL